jgi:hypothetical protein
MRAEHSDVKRVNKTRPLTTLTSGAVQSRRGTNCGVHPIGVRDCSCICNSYLDRVSGRIDQYSGNDELHEYKLVVLKLGVASRKGERV